MHDKDLGGDERPQRSGEPSPVQASRLPHAGRERMSNGQEFLCSVAAIFYVVGVGFITGDAVASTSVIAAMYCAFYIGRHFDSNP